MDHHHGSEENQPGWEYHDPGLVDPATGGWTPCRTYAAHPSRRGLEDDVIVDRGPVPQSARLWRTPVGLLFIDGGHTEEPPTPTTRAGRARWRTAGAGVHDVFPDPADGGQAPYGVYLGALASAASPRSPCRVRCGSWNAPARARYQSGSVQSS